MTQRLVTFVIPPEFVLAHAVPTFAEMRAGFTDGWLDAHGVSYIASARTALGIHVSDAEQQIALVLSDRLDQLTDLLTSDAEDSATFSRISSYWLFVSIAWVISEPPPHGNPQEQIDMLYADFDYPDEIEGLVSYMPAPPGSESTSSGIRSRWHAYVDRKVDEYAERTSLMQRTRDDLRE